MWSQDGLGHGWFLAGEEEPDLHAWGRTRVLGALFQQNTPPVLPIYLSGLPCLWEVSGQGSSGSWGEPPLGSIDLAGSDVNQAGLPWTCHGVWLSALNMYSREKGRFCFYFPLASFYSSFIPKFSFSSQSTLWVLENTRGRAIIPKALAKRKKSTFH